VNLVATSACRQLATEGFPGFIVGRGFTCWSILARCVSPSPVSLVGALVKDWCHTRPAKLIIVVILLNVELQQSLYRTTAVRCFIIVRSSTSECPCIRCCKQRWDANFEDKCSNLIAKTLRPAVHCIATWQETGYGNGHIIIWCDLLRICR
jgi:hypothetical protein